MRVPGNGELCEDKNFELNPMKDTGPVEALEVRGDVSVTLLGMWELTLRRWAFAKYLAFNTVCILFPGRGNSLQLLGCEAMLW